MIKIEGNLQRLEGRVKVITIDVNKIEAEVSLLVERALKEVATHTEFKEVLDRLSVMMDRCEELSETLHLVAKLFEDIADLSTQLDGNKNVTEELHNISAEIDLAAKSLTEMREKLTMFPVRDLTADPQKLTDLIAQTRGPVERLAVAVESVRQHVTRARSSLKKVQGKVRFWARSGAAVSCLVSAWFGWGQVCLIGWGWSRLRPVP